MVHKGLPAIRPSLTRVVWTAVEEHLVVLLVAQERGDGVDDRPVPAAMADKYGRHDAQSTTWPAVVVQETGEHLHELFAFGGKQGSEQLIVEVVQELVQAA